MGFYKVDIDLRNAPQGQYRKNCFVVSFMRDEEFSVLLDPWSSGCDNSEAQIKKRMEQAEFLWIPCG